MAKFKEGDWVYTYDEQGLVYKNQVRGNVGFLYLLTGRHEPVNTEYVFKTKKECLKAMKDAGIQKASLHMATVIKLEKKIADLEAKLAELNKEPLNCSQLENGMSLCIIQKSEITELKQQLAESEEALNEVCIKMEDEAREWVRYSSDIIRENYQLKQQLAEKDKEIESLKASSDKNIDYLIEFASLIENEKDCNKMLKALDRVKKGKKYIVDKANQDKISFCIEQLEKVKVELNKHYGEEICGYVVYKVIDNQIKLIKGE